METVYIYCKTCKQTTPCNITNVKASLVNKKEDIIALRCTKCKHVTLRKVGQEEEKNE